METPKTAIRLPRQLIEDLRGAARRDSLKLARHVSWVEVLVRAAEKHLNRQGERCDS